MTSIRLFSIAVIAAFFLASCGQATDDGPGDQTASPVETTEPTDGPTEDPEPEYGDVPAGSTGDFGLPLTPEDVGASTSDDTAQVVIWTELGCPSCKSLFETHGAELRRLVESGDASVEVRFATFLDRNSPNQHSSRATALAACTYNSDGPEVYWNVLLELYAQQPEAGEAGPDDAELLALADASGASERTQACYEAEPFAQWVTDGGDAFTASGTSGTPTVLIDGEQLGDPMAIVHTIKN